MKTAGIVLILLIGASGAARAGSPPDRDYRPLLAAGCVLKTGDAAERFFETGTRFNRDRITVRFIQKGWKGWIRIHAAIRMTTGAAWGYADYHSRSGKLVCKPDNWIIQR